jgi:hypothetical protein
MGGQRERMWHVPTIELLIHLTTFLVVFIPAILLVQLCRKIDGHVSVAFTWLFIGIAPMAIYHLIESAQYFSIDILPPEGSLPHIIIDHAVVSLAILSFGIFIYWFSKKYVNPMHMVIKKK